MAKQLSTTLKNLKFMQRAAQREELVKKEEIKPEENFVSHNTVARKCVVIMEGDPHPGAFKGRMSFKSFNPSIDKLNEEQAKLRQPAASSSTSSFESGKVPLRQNESPVDDAEYSDIDKPKSDSNGDLKRKQHEEVSESQYPNKSPKSNHGKQQSSSSKSKGSFKKPKAENLDWNILRRSKKEGDTN
ncbi:hypothetical protein UlMin_013409 [Ulmus minor]